MTVLIPTEMESRWTNDVLTFAASRSSICSQKAYYSDLSIFCRWLSKEKLSTIYALFDNPGWVGDFVNNQKVIHKSFKTKALGVSKSSIARRLAAIKSFFDWAIANYDLSHKNPIQLPSHYLGRRWSPKRLPRPVPYQIIKRFLRAIKNPRDRALFCIYTDTGARLSEIIGINENDLKVEFSPVKQEIYGSVIVLGKGHKERYLYLTKKNITALINYLRTKPPTDQKALFTNHNGLRISKNGVEARFKYWIKRSKVQPFQLHQLRHSFATRSIRFGMKVEHLQKLLGHSEIRTTLKYVAIDDSQTRQAFYNAIKRRKNNEKTPLHSIQ